MYFEITYSGIGMTKVQIEKLFDLFTLAETSTTRQYGGTGLGLPITKNIVELMGGKLLVESTLGVGSKFSFSLLFDAIDTPENDIPESSIVLNDIEKPAFTGEILLCEDNAMNQQVICEHLARVGLKTIVAWNGKIGLDMVRGRMLSGEKQFDLVFMDMHMPIMDGLEASKKIIEFNAGIPIIAMTANVMADDRDSYKKSGLQDCIGKPFTSQELWRCLLKYLTPINTEEENKELNHGLVEFDFEFQKSLQLFFIKNNSNRFNEMVNALNNGDIKLAHRIAHNLKGNAGQLGFMNLQMRAADIEHQLKDGVNYVNQGQLESLNTELNIVIGKLKHLMEDNIHIEANLPEKILNMKELNELFNKLESLLKSGNPDSLNYRNELYLVPVSDNNGKYLIQQLIQKMEDFEFESALVTFDALKKEINYNG